MGKIEPEKYWIKVSNFQLSIGWINKVYKNSKSGIIIYNDILSKFPFILKSLDDILKKYDILFFTVKKWIQRLFVLDSFFILFLLVIKKEKIIWNMIIEFINLIKLIILIIIILIVIYLESKQLLFMINILAINLFVHSS